MNAVVCLLASMFSLLQPKCNAHFVSFGHSTIEVEVSQVFGRFL